MRLLILALILSSTAPFAAAQSPMPDARQALIEGYATEAAHVYSNSLVAAEALLAAAQALVATPSSNTLAACRAAWNRGRRSYQLSEHYRFSDGPIDNAKNGVELFINAWPVDESYIAHLIADTTGTPLLHPAVLQLRNEQGGEANVSCGWHAIEFLLWGPDTSVTGPGTRPHTDFGQDAPHATRRGEFLIAACILLRDHLAQVYAAWRPDGTRSTYRHRFLAADPDTALSRILTSATLLLAFELSGERLAVPYETQDQEDEHSCFSDTTHLDFADNLTGLHTLYHKRGLLALARALDPELAIHLAGQLDASTAAIAAIPIPFDQAILATDRTPLLTAIEALEDQALGLAELGQRLKLHIPLRPER